MILRSRSGWDPKVANRLVMEQVFCEQYFHPKGYHAPFHSHYGTEVLYSESGHGTMRVNGKEYTLAPGSVLIFPGHLSHRASVSEDYRRWNLCALPSYFDDAALSNTVVYEQLSGTAQRNISSIFENIISELSAQERYKDEYVQLLLKQFRLWLERGRTHRRLVAVEKERMDAETLLPKVTHYIESHLQEEISVERLAQRFNYSRSQFWRLISSATGESPIELITGVRLQRAQRLLVESERSVSAIANMVGFKSPAYFSRIFRERIGLAPSEFRDKMARNARV